MTPEHPAARSLTPLRRLGYRVFPGDGFSYLLHLRPVHFFPLTVYVCIGYFVAVGLPPAGIDLARLALGLGTWIVLLSGGTMALNSACDQDEGDIGYMPCPPRAPRYLFAFGLGLLVAGLVPAFHLAPVFGRLYAACLALTVLYSVPPVRLKGVPGIDVVVNVLGYGLCSVLAGWALAERPLEGWSTALFGGLAAVFGSLYPLTQIYQIDADRKAQTQTLAVALGPKATLGVSIACASVGFGLLAVGVIACPRASGWGLGVVVPFAAAWLSSLVTWRARSESFGPLQHRVRMYRMGNLWFVTGPLALLSVSL